MGLFISNIYLLNLRFCSENYSTRCVCPACKQSLLQINKASLQYKLSKDGKGLEQEGLLAEGGEAFVFSCVLECQDSRCAEVVACNGYGVMEEFYAQNDFGHLLEHYTEIYLYPKYFYPHLCLFQIPENCPDGVKQAIEESFATFFSSITATTNSIRISIEALLREHKIPSEDEKGNFIPLHRRINNIPKDSELYPFKEQLLTLKYMGNDGSHSQSKVSKEDIVDAYEILSSILEERYAAKKDISVIIQKMQDKFKKK